MFAILPCGYRGARVGSVSDGAFQPALSERTTVVFRGNPEMEPATRYLGQPHIGRYSQADWYWGVWLMST